MTDETINRYKRNAEARAVAERKRSAAKFRSIVFWLLVLVAIVYWLAYKDSIDLENLSVAGIVESVRERVTTFCTPADKLQQEFRDHYMSIVTEFGKGELAHWKDVPKNLKPKNAPAGTVYYALVPRESGFDLYQLKGNGAVDEITPFGKPVPTTFDAFKKSCGGKPYFIACAGRVFVSGGSSLKMMDETRKALLPR